MTSFPSKGKADSGCGQYPQKMIESDRTPLDRQTGKLTEQPDLLLVDRDHADVEDDNSFVRLEHLPEIEGKILFPHFEHGLPVVHPAGGQKKSLCLFIEPGDFLGPYEGLEAVPGHNPLCSAELKNFDHFRMAMSVNDLHLPACLPALPESLCESGLQLVEIHMERSIEEYNVGGKTLLPNEEFDFLPEYAATDEHIGHAYNLTLSGQIFQGGASEA